MPADAGGLRELTSRQVAPISHPWRDRGVISVRLVFKAKLFIWFSLLVGQLVQAAGSAICPSFESDVFADSTEAVSIRLNERRIAEFSSRIAPQPPPIRVGTLNAYRLRGPGFGNPRFRDGGLRMSVSLNRYLGASSSPDIFFSQEVWGPEEQARVASIARSHGYVSMDESFGGRARWASNVSGSGLQTLVSENAFKSIGEARFEDFRDEGGRDVRVFWERAAGIKRGLQYAYLETHEGLRVLAAQAHLTALAVHQDARDAQIDDLARKIARLKQNADILIVGADLNLSATYDAAAAGDQSEWFELARRAYALLSTKLRAIDAYSAVVPASGDPGYTFNPGYPEPPALRFYRREPSVRQRMDFIFVAESSPRVRAVIAEARVTFGSPVRLPFDPPESSGQYFTNHFGVEAVVQPFRSPID